MRHLLLISLAVLCVACADLTAPHAVMSSRSADNKQGTPRQPLPPIECVMHPDTTTLVVDGVVFTEIVWQCR